MVSIIPCMVLQKPDSTYNVRHEPHQEMSRLLHGGTHWPCEAEGKADWVGEAVCIGFWHLEGVGAQDRGHSSAVGAGGLRGDVGLIML